MYRETRKRKIIIFSLIGILLLMAVGYAAFQTNLDVKGNSQITSNWDVEIINVKEGEKAGLAESAKTPTWTKTEASMETNLYQKGDSMSYIVTIENKGSFDAKLDNINLGKGTNEEAVNITFSGYTKGQTLFKGTTIDITVTISYNPNYEGGETSSEVNTDFEFSQAEGGTITPTTDHLVTYDYLTNGGTSSNSENEYLPEGSNINLEYTAEKEGYEFVGWNTNASAKEGLKDIQINEDTTLYAIFKKDLNVTYEMGEGVTSTEKEAEVCSLYNNDKTCEITLPEITVNTAKGYEIDGWYNGDTKIGDSNDKYEINSDITLTAKAKEPEPIMQSWGQYSTSDFHSSTYKSNITSVEILTNKDVPEDAVASWDVSSKKNGSVMAWVINDPENTGKYKLYIGGNGGVIANSNSSSLFYNFTGVTEMNLSNLDTSKVTNMSGMFYNCSNLTELDLSNFDTSNVTIMSSMFYRCSSLTELDLSNFDTSKVTNMIYMFSNCSSLTELDLSNFDTSKVTNMSGMFYYCSSLTELDLSNFDTSKVTSMYQMFYCCSSLTELDVSSFDTSNVTNMSYMFYRCSSLTALDVSNFNTSNVANMGLIFYNCSSLTELDLSNFDTSKVTSMSYMFTSCRSLTTLDVSNFDTSKVTDMSYMFSRCSGLTELDVSNFDTSNVANMGQMFYNCSKLTALDVSNFDTSNVTNMSQMFDGCSSLTTLDLNNFDTSKVTDMSFMFYYCESLTALDVSNFDTSNVTSMSFMFRNCSGLTELDVSSFDTSKVTNMSYMFQNCSSLTTLDLSNFDTSNVTNMSYMFDNCRSLTKLVLCSFDTSKVTNMNQMFIYTSKLDVIYVGPNWTTENASTTAMFSNSGVSSVTQSDNCEIESEDPASISVSTTKTTNSITVSVSASAPSNISKYEYSKDGGNSWVEGSTNLYTFTGLTEGTEYDIMVRVTSGKGKQTTSEITKVTTNTIGIPTFTESEISNGKRVTITYPEGCGSKYTCTYQKDNESFVAVTGTTVNVTFTDSGSVVAKVSDGTNTASSSYNVTVIVDITDNVVTSGDGLYADEYEEGRYVYRGANPNNYIEFNNELWRIISKEADGTYKIVRNEVLPEDMPFDENNYRDKESNGAGGTYCANSSYGCNAWAATANMVGSPAEFTNGNYSGTVLLDSSLNTYLNGEYLNSITVNKDKIVSHNYNIGAVVYNDNDLATQIEGEKAYKWNGEVGLISDSDYINANSDMNTCGTHLKNHNNYGTCRNTNWMYISGTYWWSLSPSAYSDYADLEFYVSAEGRIYNYRASYSSGVRPAVYLTSSLSLSGSGTESDPYRIIG